MSKVAPSISVFFPFLNDWGTVGSLITLAISALEELTDDWEVIIVNDGSKLTDREALFSITEELQNRNKIKILNHDVNKGYGGALKSGFLASTKDLIFYTDCDAQYDPREIRLLYQALRPDIGMVNGYKIKRNDPWFRVIAGGVYHHLVKIAFGLPIRDTDCDFRLIRRSVFKKIHLFEDSGTICVELIKKVDAAGYKIAEVAVHHFWRTSGKSQFFNFQRLGKTGINLFSLWWKLIIRKDFEN